MSYYPPIGDLPENPPSRRRDPEDVVFEEDDETEPSDAREAQKG